MEDRFDILMIKKLTGDITPNEQMELEAMLKGSESSELFNDYKDVWSETERYKTSIEFDAMSAYENHVQNLDSPKTKPRFAWRSIAAAIALLLFCIVGFNLFLGKTTISSGDYVKTISLYDKTEIVLAKNSTISFDKKFGKTNRNIELEGKAFFDVFHNSKKPFVVSTSDVSVTVLGTKFEVNRNSVAVKQGKVMIGDVSNNEQILSQGEKVYVKNIAQIVNVEPEHFKWTNEELVFENASLSTVLMDIENHFNLKFEYNKKRDYSLCKFTSKSLVNVELNSILSILESTFECSIAQVEGSKYEIKNIKCR